MIEPLYTSEDAEKTQPLFRAVDLGQATEVGPGIVYRSIEAGHMLGSTSRRSTLNENGKQVTLGFSGDVGRKGLPIIRDPQSLPRPTI